MLKLLLNKIKKLAVNIMMNIHTILLITGMGFLSISAFLVNLICGYAVTGIVLMILGWLISREAG